VHGVVNRHRGSARVRSEHGGGTTVTLWFPAAPGHTVETRMPEIPVMPEIPEIPVMPEMPLIPTMPTIDDPPEEEIRAAATVSILVLEDEEHIRTMLVEALTGAGHRVESATDGLTGLARFQGGVFDVVLTDLSLPECSGLDVARSVKRMRPETPVVLITGWGHLLDPERLRDSGVDLMLVKPFRLERVLSVVGDALRLRPIV
jgi:CheY-like chemotaxis protein